MAPHALDRDRRLARSEQRDAAHVHAVCGSFQVVERRVERGETFHARVPPSSSSPGRAGLAFPPARGLNLCDEPVKRRSHVGFGSV